MSCVHFQMGLNDFAILFKFIATMTFQFIFCSLQSLVNINSSAIFRQKPSQNTEKSRNLVSNPESAGIQNPDKRIAKAYLCSIAHFNYIFCDMTKNKYVNSFIEKKILTKRQVINSSCSVSSSFG